MPTIYLQNNLCQALASSTAGDSVVFIPKYFTTGQKAFLTRRFEAIKRVRPQAIWSEHIDQLREGDRVYAWDAQWERRAFGRHLVPDQNRLFDTLSFVVPDSFSAFRKKVEPLLPSHYQGVNEPYDGEVASELDYYFDDKKLPSTYFTTRNGLLGRDYSSKFSAYLACGALDVRVLYNRIKDYEREYGSNKSTTWLVFELLWREFFYWHYHRHTSKYFSQGGLKGPADFSPVPEVTMEQLKAMKTHDFFQAAVRELEQTGFLGNRMRQLFASYWLNELDLNWRSGAQLFELYLIDYDVYSNYGNWMYLAGVGVDPRGKRHFHIDKQLRDHDPHGHYLKHWLDR